MKFLTRYEEYHFYKKQGVCVQCHREDAVKNQVRCEYCRNKHVYHVRKSRSQASGHGDARRGLTGGSSIVFRQEKTAPEVTDTTAFEAKIKELEKSLELSRRTCAHYIKLNERLESKINEAKRAEN